MISKSLVKHACQLAAEISANAILIYADVTNAVEEIGGFLSKSPCQVIMVTRKDGTSIPIVAVLPRIKWVSVPDYPMTRIVQIKMAVLVSLARGILKKGDTVVLMTGIERSQKIDTIMVLNLETESELVSVAEPLLLGNDIDPEVFERVLNIAAQIAFEGREGRQIGAIFVIGDSQKVLESSENLVLNPFFGYPESRRSIMDPRLEETVKEFSTIDGAFVIRGDGIIEAAGIRLLATKTPRDFPKGLGTRHASAAAISMKTKGVAICVSQSTGGITIFKSGHLVAEISRSSPDIRHLASQMTNDAEKKLDD